MTSCRTVLIVDDEPPIRELLEITLNRMQLKAYSTGSLQEARAQLLHTHYDLCLTDMCLPDGNGLELVQHIQHQYPHMPVAMITAYGSVETAISALKAGAFDFLTKPVDIKRLRELINNALRLKPKESSPAPSEHTEQSPLLGQAPAMQALRPQILKLARSQAPVYISGESGTGKELAARQIHEQGPRAQAPFVPVNCGAIPSELMEREFFGHLKGSFTGATDSKQGLFQAAQGGTLFLDEVADLPLSMQVKLLRAIQEKAIRPLGSPEEQAVDVRILCATHKDLATEVQAGRFRQDLYYRLNVIELHIPALRERREDIPLLAEHILQRLAKNTEQPMAILQPQALQQLLRHSFPGNVRELENLLERAYTLCDHQSIGVEDLQFTQANPPLCMEEPVAPSTSAPQVHNLEQHLESVERHLIMQALEETRWNRTAAAQRLGLSFRSMRYRLKKLGLD